MPHHDTLTQDVKTKAHDLGAEAASAARAKVSETAREAQDRAAREASTMAHAADAAAQEFTPGSLQEQISEQIAMQAERLAHGVATIDMGSLERNVSDFARRNPLLFLGGAAALGFAATRFLKARDPDPTSTPQHDPWAEAGGHDGIS